MKETNAVEEIKRNTLALISEEEMAERLKENRPLRIKLGVDPTRPDLTFGHMVVFNKLRQFQDLGHEAILIIGDFTTLIGDPSGRSDTRPVLTKKEIDENARTYTEQAFKVLDKSKTTVRFNSEWFAKMNFEDCLALAREVTVARMLERDDFAKRYADKTPISIIEFLYPLVQGYDSVMIESDAEMGGNDQLFNMLVGRVLQKNRRQKEQIVLTLPLLVGLDGVKKMSKSQENYIAFNDTPQDMFGKIMSVSDEVMWDYYQLLLLAPDAEIRELKQRHPMEVKKELARRLTAKLHTAEAADRELARFEKVFSQREQPDDMPAYSWKKLSRGNTGRLVNLMSATGLFPSKKEIRRLIEQGAVKIDGQPCRDSYFELAKPDKETVVQAGKRIFLKIVP